jgi:signal transduction histidine kinase
MKEEYESEKKDKEIALLNKEKAIRDLQLKKQKQAENYFIAGLVLLFILAFFAYRNYHNRQKLKLLTLRNKIASDLHDDVGSTLSSISIFSQMAQAQSKETIPMLETIGESSRKMLDAMADIVWTIKPENDQFEKIIMRMRNFAYELLGAKRIDFEFVTDEEVAKINLSMEVRKNLYLIFKEATNNMVKYAQANKAMFAIKGEKNNLTMMIRDNGKGFDVNKPSQGNGLKNMIRRAEEIGAKLVIDSFPGNGTTIQLSVGV